MMYEPYIGSSWIRIRLVVPVLTTLCMLALLGTSELQAQPTQGQPGSGMLFSQSPPAALMYDCKSVTDSRVTCSFIQLDVYKVRYPSVDETLSTSWASIDTGRCAAANRALAESLERVPNPSVTPTAEMGDEGRRIDELKATVEFCKTGKAEAWREHLTRERERQQRTCTLSAHPYIQTFRRESVGSTNAIRWVTEQQPYGECRLHREAQFTSDDGFWSYSARYKVLNKSGQDGPLICEEIREQEAVYVASQNEETEPAECENIRFGVGCYSPDFPCLGDPPVVVH